MREQFWQINSDTNKYSLKDHINAFDQRRRLSSPVKFDGTISHSVKRERKYSDLTKYPPNSPSRGMSIYLSKNQNIFREEDAFLSTLLNRSHMKHRLLPPLDHEPTGITYSSYKSKYPITKQVIPIQNSFSVNNGADYEYDEEEFDDQNYSGKNVTPKIKKINIKVKTISKVDSYEESYDSLLPHHTISHEEKRIQEECSINEGNRAENNSITDREEITTHSVSPRMKLPRSSITNIPKKDSISDESIQQNLSILQKFEELRQESKKRENFCNCKLHNHQHSPSDHKSPPTQKYKPPPKPPAIQRRKPSLPQKSIIFAKKTKPSVVNPPPPVIVKEKSEVVAEIEVPLKESTPIPSPIPSISSESEDEIEPECEIPIPEILEESSPDEENDKKEEEHSPRAWCPPKTPNPLKGAHMCLDSLKWSKEELVKIFRKIDKDMDGYVNFHQIKPEIPPELTQSEVYFVKEIFDITDGSTFFGLQEYILFMILCQKISFLQGPARNAYRNMKDLDLKDVLTEFVSKFQKNETEPMSGISIDKMFDIIFEMRGDIKPSSLAIPPSENTISDDMDEKEDSDAQMDPELSTNKPEYNFPIFMNNDQLYDYIYEELSLWNVTNVITKLDYISYLPLFISVSPSLQANQVQRRARHLLL